MKMKNQNHKSKWAAVDALIVEVEALQAELLERRKLRKSASLLGAKQEGINRLKAKGGE